MNEAEELGMGGIKDMQWRFPRAMGKTVYFTEVFLKECKAKNTAEYHHPDYVVMSRAQYDKIQKMLNKSKVEIKSTQTYISDNYVRRDGVAHDKLNVPTMLNSGKESSQHE